MILHTIWSELLEVLLDLGLAEATLGVHLEAAAAVLPGLHVRVLHLGGDDGVELGIRGRG